MFEKKLFQQLLLRPYNETKTKTKQTFVGDAVGLAVGELVGLPVGDVVGCAVVRVKLAHMKIGLCEAVLHEWPVTG